MRMCQLDTEMFYRVNGIGIGMLVSERSHKYFELFSAFRLRYCTCSFSLNVINNEYAMQYNIRCIIKWHSTTEHVGYFVAFLNADWYNLHFFMELVKHSNGVVAVIERCCAVGLCYLVAKSAPQGSWYSRWNRRRTDNRWHRTVSLRQHGFLVTYSSTEFIDCTNVSFHL